MSLLRPIATIGGLTLVSRVLGFTRDVLAANVMGATMVADCFNVAFKLPNFFRRLFAEGAFNAGFVPSFSGYLKRDDPDAREKARLFAEQVLAFLLVILLPFTALFIIFMPWAMYILAPGFAEHPEKQALAIQLTRLTFPYLLFISLTSLQGGILNSMGKFFAAAAAPILLNIVLIAALVWRPAFLPTQGHAQAWAVSVAGMAQFVWLVFSCRRAGMGLRLVRPRLSPEVKRLLSLIWPAALGAGAYQINLMIDLVIGSFLPTGSLSYLYYADRIMELPLGVIGIAVGTALLPLMSRQLANGEDDAALHSQNRSLEFALLLTLPAAAALVIIPGEILAVLYQHGAFTATDTARTSGALVAFALGLPAHVLTKIFTPGFYARHDTRTPVRIAITTLAFNTLFSLIFVWFLGFVALALATSLAAWLNAGQLWWILRRKKQFAADAALRRRVPRILLASAAMAASLWFAAQAAAPLLAAHNPLRYPVLAGMIAGGMAVYGAALVLAGAFTVAELKKLKRRRTA